MRRHRLAAILLALSLLHAGAVRGEIRIAAVGTSLTQNGGWPDRLARAVASCVNSAVVVTKFAAAGQGSGWGVGQLERIILARPAIVLIEFAINDADILDGLSLAASRKNHELIVERLRAALPEVAIFLVTTNPVHGPRGWVRPFLAEYYQLYRELARERSVGLIDLNSEWRKVLSEEDRDLLIPDGLHPAHAAVSRIVLPVLRRRMMDFLGAPRGGCS